MHELIAKLTEYLSLTPEQQFRVSAMIKRNIHEEKASVFHRYFLYSQGPGIYDRTDPENPKLIGHEPAQNPWLTEILEMEYKKHAEWAKFPDEKVITWAVGSFTLTPPQVDPCSVCGVELTGKSYTRSYFKGVSTTYCPTHAPKDDE